MSSKSIKSGTHVPRQDDSGDAQRDALERSQKNAAADQPKSYRDDETADKVVEIGPDVTEAPIEGLDPPERGGRRSIETQRKS